MTRTSSGIRIEDLHFAFGATEVLKGVNLEIEPGEFFAFLGPSGSGKSTLLRAIAGFGPKPRGRILIGDRDVVDLPPWKRNVGLVFQNYALWPHMSVRRNIAFGLEERRTPKAETAERVEKALDLVGLLDLAERMPSQLSGGQQQRVALARTVVVEPEVLLLDEPLSNLDANLRVTMRRELLALQRKLGITTIFVTHDQEEANTTADRMAVLEGGVLQQIGAPIELYDSPANLFVAKFLGTANILAGEVATDGASSVFITRGGKRLPLSGSHAAGPANVVLRPQNITVGMGAADTPTLRGEVAHREFLGAQIRYLVRVGDAELIVDCSHQRGAAALSIGEAIDLTVSMDQAVVFHA